MLAQSASALKAVCNAAEVEREKMKAERQIKQYAKSQDLGSAKVRYLFRCVSPGACWSSKCECAAHLRAEPSVKNTRALELVSRRDRQPCRSLQERS